MTVFIITTIWKKPFKKDKVESTINSGADVLRIKCSHNTPDEIITTFKQARRLISDMDAPVKLLADLPEAKVRLGDIKGVRAKVNKGDKYRLRYSVRSESIKEFVPIDLKDVGEIVYKGESLILGDGKVIFEVTRIFNRNEVEVVVRNSNVITRKMSVMCPSFGDLDHLTKNVETMCERLVEVEPEFVAFSFVGSAKMFLRAKDMLSKSTTKDWSPKVIAKIENADGVRNIQQICEIADLVMVARGDLALTTPYEKLAVYQKNICEMAHKAGKKVIVATEILDSMEDNSLPSRSDITDVANMVRDGADYIMLCRVTAHGADPGNAVAAAKRIIQSSLRLR